MSVGRLQRIPGGFGVVVGIGRHDRDVLASLLVPPPQLHRQPVAAVAGADVLHERDRTSRQLDEHGVGLGPSRQRERGQQRRGRQVFHQEVRQRCPIPFVGERRGDGPTEPAPRSAPEQLLRLPHRWADRHLLDRAVGREPHIDGGLGQDLNVSGMRCPDIAGSARNVQRPVRLAGSGGQDATGATQRAWHAAGPGRQRFGRIAGRGRLRGGPIDGWHAIRGHGSIL